MPFDHGEITLKEMMQSKDWVQFMLDLPMAAEPGGGFEYCSGGMHLLSGIISQATGSSALEFARRELFQPLGIENVIWPSDPQGVSYGWGDLHLRPRDMAKIGYLWLHQGRWEGRQVVPDGLDAGGSASTLASGLGQRGVWLWVSGSIQKGILSSTKRWGAEGSVSTLRRLGMSSSCLLVESLSRET